MINGPARRGQRSAFPSAIQVRLGAIKGVLVLDKRVKGAIGNWQIRARVHKNDSSVSTIQAISGEVSQLSDYY